MSDAQQDEWKARWLPKGLPSGLLDEMIAEANAEYETELGVWKFNNFANVLVHVTDVDLEENEFYIYIVQRAETVFFGEGTYSKDWSFTQVPCTEIVFQVFKMHVGESITAIGYGFSLETISKDTDVNVTISAICETPPPTPQLTTANLLVNQNFELGNLNGWTLVGEYSHIDHHQYCTEHSGAWQCYLYWNGYLEQTLIIPLWRGWCTIFTVCFQAGYDIPNSRITLYFNDSTSRSIHVFSAGWVKFNLLTAIADEGGLLFPEGKILTKIRFTPDSTQSITVDDVRINE